MKKIRFAPIFIGFFLGMAVWLIDSYFDATIFYKGRFLDLAFLNIPPHEFYIRLMILALFIVFGAIISFLLFKHSGIEKRILDLSRFPSENPNPVLRISREGKILFANAATRSLLKQEGLSMKNIFKILPIHLKWLIKISLEQNRALSSAEIRLQGRIYSYSIAPVLSEDYVNLYGQDITERKNAEKEILSLSKFPSENPYPVLRISKDSIILYKNEAAEVLLDKDNMAVGAVAPEKWRNIVNNVFSSGRVRHDIEIEERGRIFSWMLVPISELDYINVYGTDITKQKHAEESLKHAKLGLEEKVKERTKELQQRLDEVERYYAASVDRELRIKELRDKLKGLENS